MPGIDQYAYTSDFVSINLFKLPGMNLVAEKQMKPSKPIYHV